MTRKYLVIERHILQIQGILLQYLKLNWPADMPITDFLLLLSKCNKSKLVVDLSGYFLTMLGIGEIRALPPEFLNIRL